MYNGEGEGTEGRHSVFRNLDGKKIRFLEKWDVGFKLYVEGHRKLRGGEGSCRVEGDQFYEINVDTVCLDLSGKLCLRSVENQKIFSLEGNMVCIRLFFILRLNSRVKHYKDVRSK